MALRIRHWSRWWLTAVLAAVVSCTTGEGPTAASPAVPSFEVGNGEEARAEHQHLEQELAEAKARFKAERTRHHREFELAHRAWGLFKKEQDFARKHHLDLPTQLLRCEPQEYVGDAAIIGPKGGTIHVGEHTLRVLPGALDHEVLISAEAPVSDLVEVDLEPHGLRFAEPAQLELSYRNCIQPPEWLNLFVVYLGADDRILEVNASRDKKGLKSVTGELEHFSRYAIAW